MEYTNQTVINAPLEKVSKLYADSNLLSEWDENLKETKLIFGEEMSRGSRYELTFMKDGKEKTVKQTIINIDLPNHFSVKYESNNLYKHLDNKFTKVDNDKTLWELNANFAYTGIMSLIGFLYKNKNINEIEKNIQAFKEYAESTSSDSK